MDELLDWIPVEDRVNIARWLLAMYDLCQEGEVSSDSVPEENLIYLMASTHLYETKGWIHLEAMALALVAHNKDAN